MKRFVSVMVVIFSMFVISACGRNEEVLRVGMDLRYPPFETIDDFGAAQGISVDIAKALGEYLNRKVEIVNTDFAGLILSLNSGEIDIVIASMSITDQRKQSVDFTKPYFYFKILTLLNKQYAEANNLTVDSTVEELLALQGTRYVGIASQVSASIPASYQKTVIEATLLSTAIESVAQGTADALLMSANPVIDGFKANPNTTIVMWDPFVASPIGMAVKKGNTELLNKANAFIETFDDDGGLYEILSAKWDAVILDQLGRYGLSFFINE